LSLFPVPHANAVGTNDMNNAITIISFPSDKKPRFDRHFKNAIGDVEGGGIYLSVISESMIGFGQTRRFLLYDFKKKTFDRFRIVVSLNCTIENIAIADAVNKHFIFQIQEHRGSSDPWDYFNILQLIDLSGKEVKVIKEMDYGKGVTWAAAYGKIFLYDLESEHMQVLDLTFEPSHHPLADIVNRNKNKIDLTRAQPHDSLPFAILFGGETGPAVAIWGKERDSKPTLIVSDGVQFSFSPDGKWATFKNEEQLGRFKTYIMPVSEKYPYYLGTPILLHDSYFHPTSTAWTTNPVSFVGSDGDIYRWELTNEAHPESDKATFWDYIVEKDLEKLTREKRQGLGKDK
jgi:hypothetical protein